MSEKTVRLGYSSRTNISFNGTWDTGYTREQWDTLTEEERDDVMNEAMADLVEVFELGDDEPDYHGYRWR